MVPTPRRVAKPSVHVARIGVLSALCCGTALTVAGLASAQPLPPPDPGMPPLPPFAGAPLIPQVPGSTFDTPGQLGFLRQLLDMRNSGQLFVNMDPGGMDPAQGMPPAPLSTPPPQDDAPPAPAPAPPPIWPPSAGVPGPTP